ncbi:MAG: tetratricopeptide repeat protein [Limisphaerales bacterium]
MFIDDNDRPQRSANSKNWFSRGRELLEESRYEDALVCFEEAKRLGHPKSVEAIFICKNEGGLT